MVNPERLRGAPHNSFTMIEGGFMYRSPTILATIARYESFF